MSGAIPPFPNTPSWRGAQLKHRENFTFLHAFLFFFFLFSSCSFNHNYCFLFLSFLQLGCNPVWGVCALGRCLRCVCWSDVLYMIQIFRSSSMKLWHLVWSSCGGTDTWTLWYCKPNFPYCKIKKGKQKWCFLCRLNGFIRRCGKLWLGCFTIKKLTSCVVKQSKVF
jgi:hypothetical protein